ncbi:Fe-S cluster assembly protein SufB [Dickeya sp. CFBP 2040]|nr:Fe-S cluster assembly protein SufB [Dickeya sp. CFBP 2040]
MMARSNLTNGINEDVVRALSTRRNEPEWMLEFRLSAYRAWLQMEEPHGLNAHYDPLNGQDHRDNSASFCERGGCEPGTTQQRAGAVLYNDTVHHNKQEVATGALFDSAPVAALYQDRLAKQGIIFCSFSEAIQAYPERVRQYLGTVVPASSNFFAALNAALASQGTFVYIPKGVRCPVELSTYFRSATAWSGQFERTLLIADDNSYVSYIEGCSAPVHDNCQLRTAVVEVIVNQNAEVKYYTLQNWFFSQGSEGRVLNFVTKSALCAGNSSRMNWTQSEIGSAVTWKYPSVILRGDYSTGEFCSVVLTRGHQQADTGTQMIHIGKHSRSTIITRRIAAGHSENTYRGLVKIMPSATDARHFTQCHSMLVGGDCRVHTMLCMDVENCTQLNHEATTLRIGEDQLFYCLQRGISANDAISMIVNGFCKDVLSALPLELAVEAQKLLSLGPNTVWVDENATVMGRHAPCRGAENHERQAKRRKDNRVLTIENLNVSVKDKPGINGLNLRVSPGEVHAVIGPSGAGKGTLSATLAGCEGYTVTGGSLRFKGKDLLALLPEARAGEGMFIAFQYPVEIAGVSNRIFLQTSLNAVRAYRQQSALDRFDFEYWIKDKIQLLNVPDDLLARSVNVDFSCSEKKHNDILQMAVLEPDLCILDKPDSGLDSDALKIVADGISALRDGKRAFIILTDYPHLLHQIRPDYVHVLCQGQIVRSGDFTLVKQVEEQGYDWLINQQ